MAMHPFLERQTEPVSCSTYSKFRTPYRRESMQELLDDPEYPLTLKLTGLLASFAFLTFPLKLADFTKLVPEYFWKEHARFYFNPYSGNVPTYFDPGDWRFVLSLGPESSRYGPHHVCLVANSPTPQEYSPDGRFDPSFDTPIIRYTLGHPFLQYELHEPSGIYLFKYT